MMLSRIALHIAVWSGVFIFWLTVTHEHHPTGTIAVLATAVVIASFAAGVYLNNLFLVLRFAQQSFWLNYVALLLGSVVVLDLAAVLLVGFIYDRMWRPDPLRYGFRFNRAADGFGIIVHLAAAILAMRIASFLYLPK